MGHKHSKTNNVDELFKKLISNINEDMCKKHHQERSMYCVSVTGITLGCVKCFQSIEESRKGVYASLLSRRRQEVLRQLDTAGNIYNLINQSKQIQRQFPSYISNLAGSVQHLSSYISKLAVSAQDAANKVTGEAQQLLKAVFKIEKNEDAGAREKILQRCIKQFDQLILPRLNQLVLDYQKHIVQELAWNMKPCYSLLNCTPKTSNGAQKMQAEELDALRSDITPLSATQKNENVLKLLQEEVKQLTQMNTHLSETQKATQVKLYALEKQLQDIKIRNDEQLRSQRSLFQNQKIKTQSVKTECEKLKEEITLAQDRIVSLNQQNLLLAKQKSDSKILLRDLEQKMVIQIAAQRAKGQKHDKELNALKGKQTELQGLLRAKQESLRQAQSCIATLQTDKQVMVKEKQQLQAEVKNLQKLLNQKHEGLATLQKALDNCELQKKKVCEQLEKLRSQVKKPLTLNSKIITREDQLWLFETLSVPIKAIEVVYDWSQHKPNQPNSEVYRNKTHLLFLTRLEGNDDQVRVVGIYCAVAYGSAERDPRKRQMMLSFDQKKAIKMVKEPENDVNITDCQNSTWVCLTTGCFLKSSGVATLMSTPSSLYDRNVMTKAELFGELSKPVEFEVYQLSVEES